AGSAASAASLCAPFGARPLQLTAHTLRPSRTSSPTTALPIAPVAPKTTCSDSSSCIIAIPPNHNHKSCSDSMISILHGHGPAAALLLDPGRLWLKSVH